MALSYKTNNIFAKKGKFWSRKRAKKIKDFLKQRNQNFTKESEKIVIRKLAQKRYLFENWGTTTNVGVPKKI